MRVDSIDRKSAVTLSIPRLLVSTVCCCTPAGSSSQLGGYSSGALQSMGSGSMGGGHRPPLQPQHSPHRDGRMLPPGHSGEALTGISAAEFFYMSCSPKLRADLLQFQTAAQVEPAACFTKGWVESLAFLFCEIWSV